MVRPFLAATAVIAAVLTVPGLSQPPAAAATVPGSNAAAVLSRLSEAQRVGQLLMVSASLSGVSQTTKDAITRYHVGSVILAGRSSAGVSAVRRMTNGLQALGTTAATGGVPLFVATDQEGGEVQTLSGPGFSTIPTAVRQGTLSPTTLRGDWNRWAGQLAAAGVNLDLAPVLDTVPTGSTKTNQPIGRYQREYGTKPSVVTTAGLAVVRGMHVAGIEATVKHFPGLGRASGNTDTTFNVVDTVTTRHDAYLAPFGAATRTADAGVVMVSLATYKKIDATHRAVFSPTILGGMLRHDMGFTGVIISDAMNAVALRNVSPGDRAVRFVAAGGDLALTDKPADIKAMAAALLSRARSDPKFRAKVDAACLRVLLAKQRVRLLAGGIATAADAGHLYLAEQTATNHVTVAVRDSSGWSGPVDLGAGAAFAPALARQPGGGVEIARVAANGTVAVTRYTAGGASSWQSLGGSGTSAAAVAVAADGGIAVVVRFTDGQLHTRGWSPKTGWGPWTSLGGAFTRAAPALAFLPSGDLAAYAVDQTQVVRRNIRHAGSWQGWTSLGGVADSGLAVSVSSGGAVAVLSRGSNNTLRSLITGTAGWQTVAGIRPPASPAAAMTAAGAMTAVAEGSDGKLHLATRTGSTWSGWSLLPFA